MDISTATKEQKSSAAVAWLSQNMDKAPEAAKKSVNKLIVLNNEGMNCVKKIQEMKAQIDVLDSQIGQAIGGAKVLFEVISDLLTDEQIDEYATQFDPTSMQAPGAPAVGPTPPPNVDIAGATAPKTPPPAPVEGA